MAAATLHAAPQRETAVAAVGDFVRWLQGHRSSIVMAGLLSFPYSLNSMIGGLVVAPDPSFDTVLSGIFRTAALGLANFPTFLLVGYVFARLALAGWRGAVAAFALSVAAACVGASIAYFNAWADMLEATAPDHSFAADTFAQSLSMVLIFLSHLQHTRVHEEAAKRLAAAKHLQRDARRRLAQSHLQAVQARIEPQFLFDMLDAVRQGYEGDPQRAELLLDELVVFLRAALPRLQHASSSVPREAELARACARLHQLAGKSEVGLSFDVPAEMMDARFPPGVLMPILVDALRRRFGSCTMSATRQGATTQVEMTLPAPASDATLRRVRDLLVDLYASSAELAVDGAVSGSRITVKVPYESA